MKKRSVWLTLASVALVAVVAYAADEDKLEGIMCVVNARGPAKAENAVEYKGAEVYFCCQNCPRAFSEDPEKHAVRANAQLVQTKQAEQVKCPLSGRDLNEEHSSEVVGVTIVFCCPNCKGAVDRAEDDQKVALVFSDEAFEKGFEVKKDEEQEKEGDE